MKIVYCISSVIRWSFFSFPKHFISFPKHSQKSRSILVGCRSLGFFRKGKTHITAKFHRTDLVICSHSGEEKTLSYNI